MDENGGGKKEGGKRGRAGSRNGLFHSPTVEGGKNGGREGKTREKGLEGEAPLIGTHVVLYKTVFDTDLTPTLGHLVSGFLRKVFFCTRTYEELPWHLPCFRKHGINIHFYAFSKETGAKVQATKDFFFFFSSDQGNK